MQRYSLIFCLLAVLGMSACTGLFQRTPSPEDLQKMIIDTKGVNDAHDPVIARDGDVYYLFSTGAGIHMACSNDLETWADCGRVFDKNPEWITIEGVKDLWAPDVIQRNGRFYLFYSASTFGSNRSAIGLASAATLDPNSPEYGWTDEGMVIESVKSDDFNAIDPNLAFDRAGNPWLAFGSFWTGIKLVRLDPQTLKLPAERPALISIAQRPKAPDAIEGAFILPKGDWYYLFVSHDFCCRSVSSNYNVKVGRSKDIAGPYLDRDGKALMEGGGTQVVQSGERWKGPGHNSILVDGDTYYLVYHSYDAKALGKATLRIEALVWDADGWPQAPSHLLKLAQQEAAGEGKD